MIKLGHQGLYFRSADNSKLDHIIKKLNLSMHNWKGRELFVPCFDVKVAGTTGAGDCTIGGFLTALLKQQSPE
ncbi:PfkB family carbohydrate kinase, partial [Pseudomonas sp. 2822-17]|uniref:PfkB family carbohydrate kinase n=1 Tax=Pseudomonas sp. 2822-17 TaxID=1712678 RepID=UPI001C475E3B